MTTNETIRPGEIAITVPEQTDAGVYFIGRIQTPWRTRSECPKRGDPEGPECRIEIDPKWQRALDGLSGFPRIQILYWMHEARRDLVVQCPIRTQRPMGTFALRSPVRPNPIASSEVALVAIEGTTIVVRGLDCMDGTPVIDIKPVRDRT
jgi:tRNA-Thr(GGU) m(6)t(6)A37 methyltransferase TsaA